MTDTRERIKLFDEMRAILTRAQEERPHRQGFVDGELDWVLFERATMLAAVNQARAEHGLLPVPMESIARAEQQAVGHSDYFKKFALYCAELVQEQQ
ncbi:spore germination YkwD domain-containing protein [Kitasatospora sp. NPDC001175]|uniref:hypothetical protein n=1 Tax=Kitasatospora sp. NPDC001175 TaxID=3157103 RepID=UPI003D01892F